MAFELFALVKDLMGLDESGEVRWFRREVERKVGDGRRNFFWKDAWVSNVPLMYDFPRLISLAALHDELVGDLCRSVEGAVRWDFGWRRELFEWEKDLVKDLLARLEGRVLGTRPDVWVWKPGEDGMFSVKSCYTLLHNLSYGGANLDEVEKVIFRDIWRSKAPAKVLAFSWTCCLIEFQRRLILRREVYCGRMNLKGVCFVMKGKNRQFIFFFIVVGFRKFGERLCGC